MLVSVWRQLDRACLRAFGRDIVYLPEAGGSHPLRGIFQRTAEPEDQAPGVYAVLFARLAELPAPPVRGDEVEIEGTRYKVFDIEADAEGAVVLRLRRST
jgi:hypothetical protein